MSAEEVLDDAEHKKNRYRFDRHTPEYRHQFEAVTQEMQANCPIAWSDTYEGHWVAAGNREVFELARSAEYLSNDHDVNNERRGYKGITIPTLESLKIQGGFLEMDPPEQRHYRQALNPYLSPAAVSRWVPVVEELVRACLDEKIEAGQIDFVDDLANVVPAVLTLAMMGVPLSHWTIYCEPVHASVYTPPDSPDLPRVREGQMGMYQDMFAQLAAIREDPRPGLIAVHYETIGVIRGAEDEIHASDLDWTISRPPSLTGKPASGTYRTATGRNLPHCFSISRADLAACMLTLLDNPATVHKHVRIAS